MQADIYDNMSSIVKDGLVKTLHSGDRVSIAAALFSIYGYAELKEELSACDSFRFIYTEPTFLKSQGEKERRAARRNAIFERVKELKRRMADIEEGR